MSGPPDGVPPDEPGELEPYLALARLIRDEVRRFAEDPTADVESFVRALDGIPRAERLDLAHSVFEALSVQQRWEVLERLFGDEELRTVLAAERQAALAEARRELEVQALVLEARAAGSLDTTALVPGRRMELGLFRAEDVAAAVPRGRESTVAARLLVLRAEGGGLLRVLDDTFNPGGGLFVTPEYDRDVWLGERLAGHALVRVGSPGDDGGFEPVVYVEGRLDVEVGGQLRPGRLHVGYVVVGGTDLFAGGP